ncbi:hypothetical protein [Rhodoblastus sp.]|uniref:hypothetical protein n=1 Tax=Rhodoblastus sp. TaxID=1962975 RepID=UPI003F96B827
MQSPAKTPNRDPGRDFSTVSKLLTPAYLFVGVFSLFVYMFNSNEHAIGAIWYLRCVVTMIIFSCCYLVILSIANLKALSEYVAARKKYIGANIFLIVYIIFFIMAAIGLRYMYNHFGADVNSAYYGSRPFSTILIVKEFVAINFIVLFFIIFMIDAITYIIANIEIKR